MPPPLPPLLLCERALDPFWLRDLEPELPLLLRVRWLFGFDCVEPFLDLDCVEPFFFALELAEDAREALAEVDFR